MDVRPEVGCQGSVAKICTKLLSHNTNFKFTFSTYGIFMLAVSFEVL